MAADLQPLAILVIHILALIKSTNWLFDQFQGSARYANQTVQSTINELEGVVANPHLNWSLS